ncbi:MAG: hypothetical protein NVSMB9_26270 [Isosphaeraceae bacterium]
MNGPPARTRQPSASSSFESPTHPSEPPPRPPAPDSLPGALVVVPETFAPVVVQENDPFAEGMMSDAPIAPSNLGRTVARTSKPSERGSLKPGRRPSLADQGTPRPQTPISRSLKGPLAASDAKALANPRPEARRPTWGEVASAAKPLPPLEGPLAARPASPRAPLARRNQAAVAGRTVSTAVNVGVKAECDYDERHRRLNDFVLPGLDGKPLRFREIDSDLVLIDFWGTWCQPCLRSIPHLVDLQTRMGEKRLAVVGVACEPGSPKEAARGVAATVQRLKINYPILLSRNDGSCPLQEALHIQAFPTMVLVDRQGRVLWRDQGATSSTLARLDRFLATVPQADLARR